MPQDKHSGLAASRYGHKCARLIAKALGAQMLGNKSNECIWNAKRALIKTAHQRTLSIGILIHMIERIDVVLGAFEEENGSYRVLQLPISRCEEMMTPTRSQGRSRDRVGIIPRKVFQDEGKLVSVVRVGDAQGAK